MNYGKRNRPGSIQQRKRRETTWPSGPAIQQLTDNGVQIVSWGTNEASTFGRADYDYFAVWTFPTIEEAQNFEKMVDGAGWYNYFNQVNVMGNAGSPQDIIGKLIEL